MKTPFVRARNLFARGGCARKISARNACRGGFTLIELLVLIAIIGILASLLLPVLSRAEQKAQGIYCMNNGHQLIIALRMYADDYNDWLPPNPEDANTNKWVQGYMNHPLEATNSLFLTDPNLAKLGPYTGPAPGLYKCPADHSTTTINGMLYDRVRTFSMSQAVGTKPDPPLAPVKGPWLDGTHEHQSGHPWRTYGRFADMLKPAPANLWIFIDEDQYSINDAAFGVSMAIPTQMVDWPGTYHNFACGVAFADGHSEIHKWTDSRTREYQYSGPITSVPDSLDILWLQSHTSSSVIAEP